MISDRPAAPGHVTPTAEPAAPGGPDEAGAIGTGDPAAHPESAGRAGWAAFPGDTGGVRAMREWLAPRVAEHSRGHDIQLVAVELATNAVKWTRSLDWVFGLSVRADGHGLRVTVEDQGGPGAPELRPMTFDLDGDALPEGGRGLALVEALADAWGVEGDEHGRHVWAAWS